MMRLVAGVAVLVRLTEVALEHLAVSETGAIVLRSFLMQPHPKRLCTKRGVCIKSNAPALKVKEDSSDR